MSTVVRVSRLALLTFLASGAQSPAAAQSFPLSGTFVASRQVVAPGDPLTMTFTLVNRSIANITDLSVCIGIPNATSGPPKHEPVVTFRRVTAPSGWKAAGEFLDDATGVSYTTRVFTGPTLRGGSSAKFTADLLVGTDMWPGAQIPMHASLCAAGLIAIETSVSVEGTAPLPTSPSQLFKRGQRPTAVNAMAHDDGNGLYLSLTNAGLIANDVNGNPLGPPAVYDSSGATAVAMVYSADISNGSASGGAMLVLKRFAGILARPVLTQGLEMGEMQIISDESGYDFAAAYSSTSRVFLIVWDACPPGAVCRTRAGLLDLQGQLIGAILDLDVGDGPDVAWNPVSNEFGVIGRNGFVRLAPDGRVTGQSSQFGGLKIAVNTESGNYVVVARRFGGTFGVEMDRAGRVISRGLVSATWSAGEGQSVAMAFNPVSRTFLLQTRTGSSGNNPVVELNQHGAPLSQPIATCNFAVTASRSDAAEWGWSEYDCPSPVAIGTNTRNGGSEMRLGGCASLDPFASLGGGHCYDGGWLPPGIDPPYWDDPAPPASPQPAPAPSTCGTKDPFASIGGGTCINGGWLPPGMGSTPQAPAPAPGPGECATSDPFATLGGGVCQNGGWIPRGLAPSGSGS